MVQEAAPCVLVIEDEAVVALDVCRVLADAGYKTMTGTGDAISALERAEKTPPDIAIVDVSLAGEIDGLSAARELDARYGTQIIFATGFAEQVLRNESELDYLLIAKPFFEKELLAVVARAASRLIHKHAFSAEA